MARAHSCHSMQARDEVVDDGVLEGLERIDVRAHGSESGEGTVFDVYMNGPGLGDCSIGTWVARAGPGREGEGRGGKGTTAPGESG